MASLKQVDEPLTIAGNYSVVVYECDTDITAIQFTEECDYLLVGTAEGRIHALEENAIRFTLAEANTARSSVTGLKHHPVSPNHPITNTFMSTYMNGMLKCWNYNFKECTYTTTEKQKTMGVAYHPRLPKFVTYGDSAKLYMYNDDSKTQERVFAASDAKDSTDGHTGTVTCACFHPRNVNELISGSMDNTVQIWDTRQPHALRKVSGIILSGPALEFTASGTEFITCSPEGQSMTTLKLRDYATGNVINEYDADKMKHASLQCGTHIDRNEFACGGGPPSFLRIVNVPNFKSLGLISQMESPVNCITSGLSGSARFAFSAGKRVYYVSGTKK